MKTYKEFIAEASVEKAKGINKDEWTYRGNGFDPKTATIERYLATKAFRKEFAEVMTKGGFKAELDTSKGTFKDANVQYAYAVANAARGN